MDQWILKAEYWHFVDIVSGFTLQLTIENVSLSFLESTASFQEVSRKGIYNYVKKLLKNFLNL